MSLCTSRESAPATRAAALSWSRQPRREDPSARMFKAPEWQWSQPADVGWWSRDGWGEVLLGPQGLRLDEWRQEGRLATIKSGPNRIVYKVELPQGTIYIKHFLVPDLRTTLRQWIRRGKGRNEGRRSVHLNEIGIPTITPIALGEKRKRQVPVRKLSDHPGHLRREPARRVRGAPSSGVARAAAVAHASRARRGDGRVDGPDARCRPPSSGLSSGQHPGSFSARRRT